MNQQFIGHLGLPKFTNDYRFTVDEFNELVNAVFPFLTWNFRDHIRPALYTARYHEFRGYDKLRQDYDEVMTGRAEPVVMVQALKDIGVFSKGSTIWVETER